jgi:hypothetical protein
MSRRTPEREELEMASDRDARSRIGVLGTGVVGRRLAAGLARRGDAVMIAA